MQSKFSQASLWLFAAIGAVASLATVLNLLSPQRAEVEVQMYPNMFAIPADVEMEISDDYKENGATFFRSMQTIFCNSENQYKIQIPSAEEKKHFCEHSTALVNLSQKISKITSPDADLYELKLSNPGSEIAKGLRLTGNKIEYLDIFNDGNLLLDNKIDETGAHLLPNLNPGDSIRVLAWSRNPGYSYESFYNFERTPRVTFEGGSVHQTTQIHVPRLYADIYSFLGSMPVALQLFMVISFSFLISLPTLFVIAAISAVIKGQPLSSIFETQSKPVQDATSVQEEKSVS